MAERSKGAIGVVAFALASIWGGCAVGPVGTASSEHTPAQTSTSLVAPPYSTAYPMGFYNGTPSPKKTAYLTFDDGPAEWTSEFLDTLAAKKVHATFFVNAFNLKGAAGLDGSYVDRRTGVSVSYRSILQRMVREGHVLGNHTLHHPDLAGLSVDQVAYELDHNQALINGALVAAGEKEYPITLIRPPFGSPWAGGTSDARSAIGSVIAQRGLNIMWNLDSSDSAEWSDGEWYTSAGGRPYDPDDPGYIAKVARLESTVLESAVVRDGAGLVVLFHDTHPTSRDALGAVIDGLRAEGYAFATLEDFSVSTWGRPSLDVTPGPALFDAMVAEKDWGCEDFSSAFAAPPRTREHEVCGRFWRAFGDIGGADVFGYPIRKTVVDATRGGIRVQWFENGRFELRPRNDRPNDVQLANVGEERLAQLGVDWRTSARPEFLPEGAPIAGCRWFDVAGTPRGARHNVCNDAVDPVTGAKGSVGFAKFYDARIDSAPRFLGSPISAAYEDGALGVWAQWFERGRLEWHPESADPEATVQLAPLGGELLGE